jgi:tetratricopeptide (TPR) repeat protein
MELFYNPDLMPEEEIKGTFVARQGLIDELVSLIERQPDGAGVQHVVIIAPRGMGKTTVLLMVRFAVNDHGLSAQWQPVKFPEESYSIYDLADFWIEALTLLAAETGDAELRARATQLRTEYPDSDDLQEAALAVIKDWRRKHNRRLLLLVDNFDLILEQINDERDNARLREVLMNDGTMMLMGCATTFFHEARAYDQPLYNFFKMYNLDHLRFSQMQDLLRRRAEFDHARNFEETLQANAGRLRVLEYFTGGNPRLALMLYRVLMHSDISDVQRSLEKLLDEVTPYFKAKVESLPPQQRKILDHIARLSSETNEGLTPTEIAEATRLTANQASAQLKRLSDLGYVRAANLRGRRSYYTLSEPLYAIWHQMRFGREARRRMQWLVGFLKVWYGAEELGTESERLASRFREHLSAGRVREALDALEHRRYLAEAMSDSSARANTMESVIRGYLGLQEIGKSKELLSTIGIENLSDETLNELYKAGCISEQYLIRIIRAKLSPEEQQQLKSFAEAGKQGIAELGAGRREEAVKHHRALETRRDSADPWIADWVALCWLLQGLVLIDLGRYEEAVASCDQSLGINPGNHTTWYNRGVALANLGRYEEALSSFDRVIEIKPDNHETWYNRGVALANLGRYEEAIVDYDRAIKIKPDHYEAWHNRGVTLGVLGQHEKALANLGRAAEINPGSYETWTRHGITLGSLGRYEEAIVSFDRALEITPDYYQAWSARGVALDALGKFEEAIASFDRVLGLIPQDSEPRRDRAFIDLMKFRTRVRQGRLDLAKRDWGEVVSAARHLENAAREVGLPSTLVEAARLGHLEFVRQLIAESDLEGPLFPLARAIDYLLTGDEALIEKLSPEVRGIVEELVGILQKTAGHAGPPKTKSRARKTQPASRRRTTKQLR